MTIRAAFLIGAKDLRQRLRDRSAYITGILAPLGLVLILNATLGGATGDSFGFRFAAVDQDGGDVAAGFLSVLRQLDADGVATIETVETIDEADRLVEDDEVSAAFILPAGLSVAVEQSQPADIRVIANPEAQIGSQVARAIAGSFTAEVNAVQLSVGAVFVDEGRPFDADRASALAVRAASRAAPAQLSQSEAEGSGFDFTTYYAVGMAVFFLFFTVQFGILSLIDETTGGTMTRLIAAPIRPASIILGKAVGAFAVGLAGFAVMVMATSLVLGAEWGDPLGVTILAVAGVLSAMGIVALTATLARTPEQAAGYSSIVAVVLGLLGGAFFPIDIGPDYLARISMFTPHRWLLDGFRDLSAGDSLSAVWPAVGAVMAFAAVTGGLGLARSRRLVRSR